MHAFKCIKTKNPNNERSRGTSKHYEEFRHELEKKSAKIENCKEMKKEEENAHLSMEALLAVPL